MTFYKMLFLFLIWSQYVIIFYLNVYRVDTVMHKLIIKFYDSIFCKKKIELKIYFQSNMNRYNYY